MYEPNQPSESGLFNLSHHPFWLICGQWSYEYCDAAELLDESRGVAARRLPTGRTVDRLSNHGSQHYAR